MALDKFLDALVDALKDMTASMEAVNTRLNKVRTCVLKTKDFTTFRDCVVDM